MPTIRPVNFPSVPTTSQPGQESASVRRPLQAHLRASTSARPGVRTQSRVQPGQRVKQGIELQSASELVKLSRDRKLKQAIHVLRAKSVELYQRDGARTRAEPQLGQMIDIKV